jgi:hypothetical protein
MSRKAAPKPPKLTTDAVVARAQLAKVRAFVTELPDVTERASHGAPTWFVDERLIGYFCDNHHGDGRIALWLAAPDGAQAMLVDSSPDVYFVPPYVGKSGWIGVRLDRDAPWAEIEALLESAHTTAAAKKRKTRTTRTTRTTRKR